MKTGIATVSISGNLTEKIAAIAAVGFTGIEIFEQDFIVDANSGGPVRPAGGTPGADAGANILYDRDGDGEFFQFYSRALAGGVFFEIVERRGAYAGYGAANAPFRIAAQKCVARLD